MSRPVYPPELPPVINARGYLERPPGSERDTVAGAPAKARPLDHARDFTAPLTLSKAQLAIWDAFYLEDLAGGKLSFDWVLGRTNTAARVKLTGRPTYEAISGSVLWRVVLPLQVIPS